MTQACVQNRKKSITVHEKLAKQRKNPDTSGAS